MKYILLIIFQILPYYLNAQEVWIKQAGNKNGRDNGFQIVTDDFDNCYITGNFTGEATFGDTIVSSKDADDCYIAKYNNQGELVWIKTFGGKESQVGNSLAIQSNGEIVLAGSFDKELIIDDTIIKPNMYGIFILKLNNSGTVLWCKTFDSKSFNDISEIKLDKENNIIAVGRISDTITVDNKQMISHGDVDGFLIKLNSSGNILWSHTIGGHDDDETDDISVDINNNIYISGSCNYKVFIDGKKIIKTDFAVSFIAKFSENGKLLLFKTYGGALSNETRDIVCDSLGNLYMTGYHCGTIKIDKYKFASPPLFESAMFIAKFNEKTELEWFNHYFCYGGYGFSLNIDNENCCFLTSNFIGFNEFVENKMISEDKSTSVILKYDIHGNLLDFKVFEGIGDFKIWNSCISKNNKFIFSTGSFKESFKFDDNIEITTTNAKAIFIMKCNLKLN